MLYIPSGVAAADVPLAQRPFLGGEWTVKYTFKEAILLATIAITGPTAGTMTLQPGVALPASPGTDLQLALLNPLRSSGSPLAVGISAKGATTETLVGTATFTPSNLLLDSSSNLPLGAATDVITAAAEKYVTGSPGLTLGTITNGVAGTRLGLFMLPSAADYTLIGCTGEIRVSDKSQKPKNIACGMNQSAFVKPGMSEVGTVNIGSKVRSFLEGLTRIRGQRVTLLMEGVKENSVLVDRIVLTSVVSNSPIRIPESDSEVMAEAEGQYEDALFFSAPTA